MRHHLWVYTRMFYHWIMSMKWSYLRVMHLLFNLTAHPSQHYFCHNRAIFCAWFCYLRRPGATIRWCYSHYKCTFSSSHAVPWHIPLSYKGEENGESGFTTILALVIYIIVETLRQIGRGLNNVLLEHVQVPPHSYPILTEIIQQ